MTTTPDLLALGLRAAACRGWRWMPGMLVWWRLEEGDEHAAIRLHGWPEDYPRGAQTALADEPTVPGYHDAAHQSGSWGMVSGESYPDLDDPATLGAIEYGLLPYGWYLVPILVGVGGVAGWVVYRPTDREQDRPVSRPCGSRGEALVAALEAAP